MEKKGNKDNMDLNSVKTWGDAEKMIAEKLLESNDSLAKSVIEQARQNAKKWFIIAIISISALIGTNAYWIYVMNSYEYVYQNGSGQNNYNSNIGGDVDNVTTD